MIKSCRKNLISLYSVHLPILLAILGVSVIGLGTVAKTVSNQQRQAVLSEEDKDDSENDEDSNRESEDENDENDRENENENRSRPVYRVGTTYEVEEVDDENENEVEDADEQEKIQLVSTIKNADGTTTETFKITDGEEVTTIAKTYDVNGNLTKSMVLNPNGILREEELDDEEKVALVSIVRGADGTTTKTYRITDEEEVEMRAVTYDTNGVQIKSVELNADGTPKQEDGDGDEVEDNDDNDRDEDGHEIEFEYKAKTAGAPTLNNLVEAKLEQEIETNSKLGTTVDKVELKIETVDGKYEYEGTTYKDGKLFGLFDVSIPVGIEIDPTTGRILSVSQTFWSKLLNIITF